MTRFFLVSAALFAGLAVALGAFAAHLLKAKLSDPALNIFEVGARYQMYHALGLLFIAVLRDRAETSQGLFAAAGLFFIVGIVIFSGSLYGLSLTGIKGLGAIAPWGGLSFLIGWGCLGAGALGFK